MKTNLFIVMSIMLLLICTLSCKNNQQQNELTDTSDVILSADEIQTFIENPIKEWTNESTRSFTGLLSPRGLVGTSSSASQGMILFNPTKGTSTYLMNKKGEIVHVWKGDINSMQGYLRENGNLVRLERDPDFPTFAAGGQGGRISEYNWEGEKIWEFKYYDDKKLIHHDIELLPNGNILAISYDAKSKQEAIEAGRSPDFTAPAGIWPDKIIEIKPTLPEGGEVVWEWKMWDHLIQDFDAQKSNYGIVADNPRKLNINPFDETKPPKDPPPSEQVKNLIELGILTSNKTSENWGSDITHVNAIAYNTQLDQIAISSPDYSEIFIIDHSTTTEEAKGSIGGKWGHGGDLLYRWGNPQNYDRGSKDDRVLFGQHDIRWIEDGRPGAGNLMVFNNNIPDMENKISSVFSVGGNPENPDPQVSIEDFSNYSSVYEFVPPMDENKAYQISEGQAFGPKSPLWSYSAPDKYSFYSGYVSGAERMKNGNTLILSGAKSRMFEVNEQKQLVWDYWSPYRYNYKLPDGTSAQPGGNFVIDQFRIKQYDLDFPGFSNKKLVPIDPQPEHFIPPTPQVSDE